MMVPTSPMASAGCVVFPHCFDGGGTKSFTPCRFFHAISARPPIYPFPAVFPDADGLMVAIPPSRQSGMPGVNPSLSVEKVVHFSTFFLVYY